MSVIRLGGFRGEIPRTHPRLLPEGAAQTAQNLRFESGALESVKDVANLQSTTLASPISLYRFSASIWLEAVTDTDFVPFPIANDEFTRVIFTDPSADEPRVTDATLVGVGGYPANFFRLDVPAPTQGFAITLNGVPDDVDEIPETRFYVCTFVNSWGAEGPPSPTSSQVEWRTGQTVTLSSLPSVPAGNYNITHRRIYRVNTGATGITNFQFVTEVAVSQSLKTVTGITQADPPVVTAATHGLVDGQEVKFTGLGLGTSINVGAITQASPPRVTTVDPHGFSTGDTVILESLGSGNGMDELNDVRNVITVLNTTQFELDGLDSTAFVAYAAGGTTSQVFGMDELNNNQFFVALIDLNSFSLFSIDASAFKVYVTGGNVAQVAGNSYVDAVPSASLAEVLPTTLYDPPNSALVGIKIHPAGFLAGFFGSTLAFSEPGAPHAWPIDYRFATNHDIVGLGVFGNTVAIVTEGFPYLAVGSDPAAMTMIELEMEQACVAKRGIVDFGTAIVYPSPDGLILISTNGATNITAGIFTRDQWQLLVPTSFVAFNWEQRYLCFYDDGSVQRAFLIDPSAPDFGVRYITKFATGGYKDIEEDLLYLIISDEIEKWDQSITKLQYTWKSKPVYAPRAINMAAGKIIADNYPVTFELFVDSIKRFTRTVGSLDAFRLPGGFKGEKFEVVIKGTRIVSEVAIASTMGELAVIV